MFPFSQGDYQEVTVHNPTSFPIEFYSVDFDTQYLEEEEVSYLIIQHLIQLLMYVVDATMDQRIQ